MTTKSDVRAFMLSPGIPVLKMHRSDHEGEQWLPEIPGIWRFKAEGFPWRLLYVWGDAPNRLLCAIMDEGTFGEVKSARELPAWLKWGWGRHFEYGDRLPLPAGPTVADYIARVEAGGDA